MMLLVNARLYAIAALSHQLSLKGELFLRVMSLTARSDEQPGTTRHTFLYVVEVPYAD